MANIGLTSSNIFKNAARKMAAGFSNPKGAISRLTGNPKAQKILADLGNPKALLPVIMLEGTVLTGRCYQAQKRGGEIEFRERFFEELTTASIWLFGVTCLNKICDFVAEKVFKLDLKSDFATETVNIAGKQLKDPFGRFADGRSKKGLMAFAKSSKIILSSLAAVYLIGSVIPKFNQAMTRQIIQKKREKEKARNPETVVTNQNLSQISNNSKKMPLSMQEYLNLARNRGKISFKGAEGLLNLTRAIGYNLENNNICKLLTMDVGVTGGRALHARNEDERIEIIFRDAVSVIFYVFSTRWIIKSLASCFDDRLNINTHLDPRASHFLNERILERYKNLKGANNPVSFVKLAEEILGSKGNLKITKEMSLADLENELKLSGNNIQRNIELARKFANLNAQTIAYDNFVEISNNLDEIAKKSKSSEERKIAKSAMDLANKLYNANSQGKVINIADDLNELSAQLNKSKILYKSDLISKIRNIISVDLKFDKIMESQIKDSIRGGLISDPEFYYQAVSKAQPDLANPRRFVSQKEFMNIRRDIKDYTKKLFRLIEARANGKNNITEDELKNIITGMKNKNFMMKAAYILTGLGISATFLSFIIPKVQYYITERRSGENKFPGIKDLQIS